MNAPSQPSLFAIDNIINDVEKRIAHLESLERKANKDLWVCEAGYLFLHFVDVEKRKAIAKPIEQAHLLTKAEALRLNGRLMGQHKVRALPVATAFDIAIEASKAALKALQEARAKSVDNGNKV